MYTFFFQSFIEHSQKLLIAYESPPLGVVKTRRTLARKTLYDNIGPEASQYLGEELDILLDAPETKSFGMSVPLCGEGSALE